MFKRTLPLPAMFALLACGLGANVSHAAATGDADPAAPKAGAGDNAPRFDNKATAVAHPGEPLFSQYCASCHLGQVPKAPHKMFLQMMAPDAIYSALDVGIMRSHAEKMNDAQKQQVATYLGGDHPVSTLRAPQCEGKAAAFDATRKPAASGWGITPENTRHIDAADAGLTAADLPRLELKWAFAFPNAQRARSQPAVAYGAVYVGSQDGTVYALDEETGCIRWTFRAPAEVRTAVIVEPPALAGKHDGSPLVFFGDLLARVYAVDAFTGRAAMDVQGRRSPERDDHRLALVARRHAVRAGVLARSHVRRGPRVRMLHLPRLGGCARRPDGAEPLEGLHDPDAAEGVRPDQGRHARPRAVGRAGLELPGDRCQARRALRRHGRKLFLAGE